MEDARTFSEFLQLAGRIQFRTHYSWHRVAIQRLSFVCLQNPLLTVSNGDIPTVYEGFLCIKNTWAKSYNDSKNGKILGDTSLNCITISS